MLVLGGAACPTRRRVDRSMVISCRALLAAKWPDGRTWRSARSRSSRRPHFSGSFAGANQARRRAVVAGHADSRRGFSTEEFLSVRSEIGKRRFAFDEDRLPVSPTNGIRLFTGARQLRDDNAAAFFVQPGARGVDELVVRGRCGYVVHENSIGNAQPRGQRCYFVVAGLFCGTNLLRGTAHSESSMVHQRPNWTARTS